jgi:hypothetical protein
MIAAEGRGNRMNLETTMKKLVMVLALTGLPLLAMAQNGPGDMGPGQGMGQGQGMGLGGPGGGQRPPGPPPEFLAACEGKSAGASVTVNTPHGEKQGTCQLMFVPAGQGQGMGQGGQRPPQGQGGQRPPQGQGGQRPLQ